MSGYLVTGSATQAFVDALKDALEADATLMALVTGIYGAVPETARTAYPYLVIGQRQADDDAFGAGAMGLPGARYSVQLDGWSNHKGASEIQAILSRVYVVLQRRPLRVDGFALMAGSLTRESEDVFDEPDEDKPSERLYRGIQRWSAVIDEAA